MYDETEDLVYEDEVQVYYDVVTHAYCGMAISHGTFDDIEEARERIKRRISYLEKEQGCEVVELDEDEYEVLEPEGCQMVPDFCGILLIERRTR